MANEPSPGLRLNKVVILGANGAMGAGSGALFASGGCKVVLVARDLAKAEAARTTIQGIAKSATITGAVECATYSDGMAGLLKDADLIFEAVAEDMAIKRPLLKEIDAARPAGSLVATVSSGLSIREMTEGLSDGFKSHFAGIHLYNPPHVMTGVEVIPHPEMNPELAGALQCLLTERFGRAAITTADMPAFAGNRIGFKVLNEVARLAETHGVQLMDTLIGPYTGRAMAPLATIDLVGWDVHQAIVDNVAANVMDEAPGAFAMPGYMARLIAQGHFGDKTPLLGGFYRKEAGGALVLDPATGSYNPSNPDMTVGFVDEVKDLNRQGRYQQGIRRFMSAEGAQADIARRVILGYMSYGLNRAGPGEVAREYADIDRIMSAGFNWVPPSALADLIGYGEAKAALSRYGLPPCALIDAAARREVPTPLFNLPYVTPGRYFAG